MYTGEAAEEAAALPALREVLEKRQYEPTTADTDTTTNGALPPGPAAPSLPDHGFHPHPSPLSDHILSILATRRGMGMCDGPGPDPLPPSLSIWDVVHVARALATDGKGDHVDDELVSKIVDLCEGYGVAINELAEVFNTHISPFQWIFLESLSVLAFLGILLTRAGSGRFELTICICTIFTFGLITLVISDIDDPMNGFFRLNLESLQDLSVDLVRLMLRVDLRTCTLRGWMHETAPKNEALKLVTQVSGQLQRQRRLAKLRSHRPLRDERPMLWREPGILMGDGEDERAMSRRASMAGTPATCSVRDSASVRRAAATVAAAAFAAGGLGPRPVEDAVN